jgi:hypothetical protein
MRNWYFKDEKQTARLRFFFEPILIFQYKFQSIGQSNTNGLLPMLPNKPISK